MRDMLTMPRALLLRWARRLWVRVSLYAVLALAVALAAFVADDLIPDRLAQRFGPDAVMPVLTILASSMLAVSTFSLNIMVSAQRAASGNATPRLHRLMREDTTTQAVLATFIGAFVFALTSIILFRADLYGPDAAVVIMAVTVGVVAVVILNMLRWIDHLSTLGSLDDSLRRAHERAATSLEALARQPALGGVPLTAATVVPETLTDIPALSSGYVQLVDMHRIVSCLPGECRAYVLRPPGRHVLRGEAVAQVSGTLPPALSERLAAAFVTGDMRTYDQDPEFGLLALSEISSKALSPGVNDPGTAIEAIARIETLLWDHAQSGDRAGPVAFPNVFVPVPSARRLVEAGFAATARDGAGTIEVMIQLRQALCALTRCADPALAEAARDMAGLALAHAEAALPLDQERTRLREIRL